MNHPRYLDLVLAHVKAEKNTKIVVEKSNSSHFAIWTQGNSGFDQTVIPHLVDNLYLELKIAQKANDSGGAM